MAMRLRLIVAFAIFSTGFLAVPVAVAAELLALGSEPNSNQRLLSIDPTTGTSQTLATTNLSGVAGGISAFDPISRQFFFLSFPPSGGAQLNIIDLQLNSTSAKLITNPPVGFISFECGTVHLRTTALES